MKGVPLLPCHFAANSLVRCRGVAVSMVGGYWYTPGPKPLCAKHARTHGGAGVEHRQLTPAERKMIPARAQ